MDEPQNGAEPSLVAADEGFEIWRERLTTAVLWCLVGAGALSYGIGRLQGMVPPDHWPMPTITAIAFAAAVARRAKLQVRIAVLLLGLLSGCFAGIINMGLAPNALVALSVGVVMTGLLLGPRMGLVYVGASVVGLFVISGLFRASVLGLERDWSRHFDIHDLGVVTRVALIFATLATGLMLSVRYMLARTEALLARNALAQAELRRETAERERIQTELAQRELAFRKASELELLGRLAGYAAHDFNNALMVIQGNAELAKLVVDNPEALDAIDAIQVAARQAAATSRQLRSFGPQPAHEERPISLAKATERVVRLLQALLPSNIQLDLVQQSDDVIAVDEGELQRVVTNLALNARDAMREGGRLRLRVFAPGVDELPSALRARRGWLALEVDDSGHGMDAATQARIFEPYFTTKGDAGTGLGLASVRDLVRARGGDVTVESEIGRGTRIVVYWPRVEVARAASAAPASRAGATGTVLVVDDNPAVRRVIVRSLEGSGLSAVEAGDGAQALQMANQHHAPIDIMLTDASMPGMPVRQLLAQFRLRFPNAGVILCSGYAPDDVVQDRTGFDAFLPKPFEPQRAVQAVSNLIAQRRASRGNVG